eukprot:5164364-Ditylum_brightwellii.AAC.1
MLEVMQNVPVPALTDLAAHFMAQGHMGDLVLEDVGGAPARMMNIPWCLLVPMVQAPYFVREPIAPGTMLTTMEKLVTYLQNPVPAEFYRAWYQAACVRDTATPLQPNLVMKATPQIWILVEVSQFVEKKAMRVSGFNSVTQVVPPQEIAGAGMLR